MSANVYSVESLLIGKTYVSKSVKGEIISALPDNRAVWYGEDLTPYLVEIQPTNSIHTTWRTIAVGE